MTVELSELSRWIAVRQSEGRHVAVSADAAERARLSERFDIVRVDSLDAEVTLGKDGAAITANGTLRARIVQSCAVSGEDLEVAIDEPLRLRFVPEGEASDEEIELEADELDEIPFTGDRFDLGEAIAQSLALAIDPFLTGPEAERVRREVGLAEPERENPFAALKGLKR
ncbi:DUF177 domain-containing protein [Croceicoccus sp. BE223]|uniref:YceD family protein n=1 Tax=Croceicoccus sp. BE223 TaxID=2817716 RepID=UPI0028679218|nr:DUF177 domain-containing protein [Croceicoccus sp. BE223]MDR7103821.1 uncharacterized metal-binding protein YceD (DUF177 family) [Croceicoccus sp. BE223]